MSTIPLNAQLHYQARFTVRGKSTEETWPQVVREVRRWIGQRVEDSSDLGRRWFFTGGRWNSGRRVSVVTARYPAAEGNEVPKFWAMRFEHPDREADFRRWAIDVGVGVTEDGALDVAATVRHWILPTYIGEEPSPPNPSCPKLVADLLSLPGVTASDGGRLVSALPHVINPGDGVDFRNWLQGTGRNLPVVYVTREYPDGEPMLDPERLAHLVMGAAHVVVAGASDVDKETEWLFAKDYRCWGGMVRVYLPGVRFGSPWDFKRHRFFSRNNLADIGVEAAYDQIVRGVVRRGVAVSRAEDRLTIDTISARQADDRLARLRAEVGDRAELKLLWEEIDRLQGELNGEKANTIELLEQNERLELEKRSMEEGHAGERWHLRERAETAEEERDRFRLRAKVVEEFATLPGTLPEVVALIARIHADRLAFTNRGVGSAEDSTLDDVGTAWRCLWAMATVLYDLVFDDEAPPAKIRTGFENATGFGVTFTEGKLTKRDRSLMKDRVDSWNGQEIDITPHVQVGSEPPNLLRVHFYADRETKRLVIGHCGEHLDTSGTRRRR